MTEGLGSAGLAITSDNLHLSEPIFARPSNARADVCTRLGVETCADVCTDPEILRFIEAATPVNTRRAYDSDLRHFLSWGGSIPATDQMVARYLAAHAHSLTIATLARRLVGIRIAHSNCELPDPTKSRLVRLTLQGIRRQHGRPQRRVSALLPSDLSIILSALDGSPRDTRDAAILLLGFAGAFRRSELAGLSRNDIDTSEYGLSIQISRSKTDQSGHGRAVFIPSIQGPLCPVAALKRWLAAAHIAEGPVFRPVVKNGKVLPRRISPEAIACIIKSRVLAIGRDPSRYSGHSLRAGFATAAARRDLPAWKIKAQTGHLSDSVLERYIRDDDLTPTDLGRIISAPREQFVDLLVIVTARRLAEVNLLIDRLRYGKGPMRSVSFCTEPVPSERDDNADDQ